MPTIEDAKAWYPVSDPVHGFDHILRVLQVALKIAETEGGDVDIIRASVLLHDAQDPDASPDRENHHHASAAFAREVLDKEGWGENRVEQVLHCIRAHRFRDDREMPQTIEAKILFDADKLDAIGAIGAVRAVAYAVNADQDMFVTPSAQFLETGKLENGEPHTPYHEFVFKLRKLKDRMFTGTGRRLADDRHRFLADFFDQLQEELKGER